MENAFCTKKVVFGTRFRETATTNAVLPEIDAKFTFTKNVVLALDLEKQYRLSQFYQKMMQNAFFSENVPLAPDLEKR